MFYMFVRDVRGSSFVNTSKRVACGAHIPSGAQVGAPGQGIVQALRVDADEAQGLAEASEVMGPGIASGS